MKSYNYYLLAGISIVLGIVLSIFFSEGHFYTFFSLGLFMILMDIYNKISDKKIFYYWRFKNFLIFYLILIISSITIDRLGMALGYWVYPQFNSFFDEVLKYVFEWVIALAYLGIFFAIGFLFFMKKGFGKVASCILSLVIFSTLAGLFTEYINLFSLSWEVLSMPISNYKIGGFFVIFQTIGYWLMAIIPVLIYKLSGVKE